MTPGGLARLLVRSCQALSAADLALGAAGDAARGKSNARGPGVATEASKGRSLEGLSSVTGGAAFLSGGAEGDMTAALRKLHELGPSPPGRFIFLGYFIILCCECTPFSVLYL